MAIYNLLFISEPLLKDCNCFFVIGCGERQTRNGIKSWFHEKWVQIIELVNRSQFRILVVEDSQASQKVGHVLTSPSNFFMSSLGNLTRGPVSCMDELEAGLLLGRWTEWFEGSKFPGTTSIDTLSFTGDSTESLEGLTSLGSADTEGLTGVLCFGASTLFAGVSKLPENLQSL